MNDVMVVSALRTPVGRMGGVFRDIKDDELSAHIMKETVVRTGIRAEEIDEVIWGQTKQSTDSANIARRALLMADFPESIPGYTVHRQCASSLQALLNGAMQIQLGYADAVLTGGVESMSNSPYYLRNARYGYNVGNSVLVDPNTESQPGSQPESVYGRLIMGMTAENLAEKYSISREEQDRFAFQSQTRAAAAIQKGLFREEIVGVSVKKKKESYVEYNDEHPRPETTLEKLATLKAVFKENGTVTAGNSSGRNDAAAAILLMSEAKCKELGMKPMARFVSAGVCGVDPRIMGIGPVESTKRALARAGLRLADIGLIELNEAFAAQSLACIKELGLNEEIVNVNGGAIALGHPLGATGARITTTLLHEMPRRKCKYGLATLCVGGGQGLAVILENLS